MNLLAGIKGLLSLNSSVCGADKIMGELIRVLFLTEFDVDDEIDKLFNIYK